MRKLLIISKKMVIRFLPEGTLMWKMAKSLYLLLFNWKEFIKRLAQQKQPITFRRSFPVHKASIMNENLINEMNSIKWWHRIELDDGLFTPGEVVHVSDGSDYATKRFGMPKDLSGKTVLDVGAWDGYFSFEAERRGAGKVVACDVSVDSGGNWGGTDGFNFAKKILKSNVIFKECSIEELISNKIGNYDVVMCYGVLYHLQNLMPAIQNLAAVTKEYALIETAVLPAAMDTNPNLPLCAFLQGFDNDPSNYWYPNTKCLKAMLYFYGFKRFELVGKCGDTRVTVKAYK
ncbi:MAG: methyltransferase domain-containing protein [Deltaproteobacteria bacterium]